MRRLSVTLIALLSLAAQEGRISPQRLREYTRFLASDLLEGRGVGSRGGDLATEYIANELALAGVKPAGDNGTWFQRVPLMGLETQPDAALSFSAKGQNIDLRYREDFVGHSQRQTPETTFEAPLVFVGHGITAPEYRWDDFKDVDVHGKVLLIFTNEPPSTDPKFFDGRALTYYGRWVYKYEEALRRGALGAVLLHTTPTAGYGWEVVRNSWGREAPFVKLDPGAPALSFQGWITREAGEKILALAGKTVDELLAECEKPGFRPIDLGIRMRGNLPTKVREIESRNVAGIVPGSDSKLKDEVVIYSAHWDHFGIGIPVNGDNIYNGAIDNATGCAALLEMAHAWASLREKPRRSALFLAVTTEEAGLRGSEYYAGHPLVPLAKTAVNINFDALFPFGRAKDVVIIGAERTSVWPQAQQIAKRLNLAISPDPQPEQGHYFRSDHFSFAHVGVPAFSVDHATEFAGKPEGFGQKAWEEYNTKHYHQPSDEFQPDWDFTAVAQAVEYGYLLGLDIANQERLPARMGSGSK
jgi:hypothetical protein